MKRSESPHGVYRMIGALSAAVISSTALTGCGAKPDIRAECVVTQPSLLGANNLTGQKGVLALIMREYGISWQEYASDRFDNKKATAKALADTLTAGKASQEIGDSDVIAVCLRFNNKDDLHEGGAIRPFMPPDPDLSLIKTEHIKKAHQVPDYLQEAKAAYPEAKLFVMNNAFTEISPFPKGE